MSVRHPSQEVDLSFIAEIAKKRARVSARYALFPSSTVLTESRLGLHVPKEKEAAWLLCLTILQSHRDQKQPRLRATLRQTPSIQRLDVRFQVALSSTTRTRPNLLCEIISRRSTQGFLHSNATFQVVTFSFILAKKRKNNTETITAQTQTLRGSAP